MPSIALDLRDAITVVTGILTIAGVIFALRSSVGELKTGQGEVLRQLGAIHKRMDYYGEKIAKSEVDHAVLVERVASIKESQRIRLRALREAVSAGQPPMFADEGEG